ncbi:MAG: methylmalonyl-CoA/ethylmalonyl-CoA epimerase [Candidatus Azotimanducaceae bacterium]|jgi:methylmalonyl-CoA/ethylmalonyl-CoA epimerase
MAIGGVDHLVILVKDIQASIETWQKLGFTLSHRADVEAVGIRQAFFLLEDGGFIELIAPLTDASPIAKTLASRGEGMHTVALKVGDLDETVAALTEQGVELIGVGTPQVFIHPRSANGVRIQLWPRERPHRWRANQSED